MAKKKSTSKKKKTQKVLVKRRLKGYSYADGKTYEMPNKQAKKFLDEGFGEKA